MPHAVPAVLVARRGAEPRERADAGQHPRGRRARLRAGARGRRGVRQPEPDGRLRGRRRRGRDRAAVGVVAAAGVPEPAPRRSRAADPAPQRLQDRRAHGAGAYLGRGRRGVPAQPGLGPRRRVGRRPARGVPGAVRRAERRARSARTSGGGAGRRAPGGRRSCCARRRAGPAPTSWTASRCRARSGPTRCRCRGWPTTPSTCGCWRSGCGRTRRRRCSTTSGRLVPELRGLAPEGDKRMSATPYANGGRLREDLPVLDLAQVRGARSRRRGRSLVGNTVSSGELMRDLYAATGHASGCSRPTRRPATGCRRCSRRPTAASWVRCWRPTTTSAPTAG